MSSTDEDPRSSDRRGRDIQSDEPSAPAPTPRWFPNRNSRPVEDPAPPVLADSGGIIGESGPPFPLPDTSHPSEPPFVSDSGRRALRRLVSRAVPQGELPTVVEAIVSNMKAAEIVESLEGGDAQTFIDAIDQACHHTIPSLRISFTDLYSNLLFSVDQALDNLDLPPRIRRKCAKSLYKMCAGHALLPRSLHFELPEDPMDAALYQGGFADVFKRQHCGREVAVKVLRPRNATSSQQMANVRHRQIAISCKRPLTRYHA